MSVRRLAILGATGSIGTNALDVAAHLDDLTITAVSAHRDAEKLGRIAKACRPGVVALTDRAGHVPVGDWETLHGPDALCEIARRDDVDVVLLAVVGAAGARAAMAAVEAGKTLCLANKEALVVAGPVLMPLAKKTGATILPVDSEHSAVFQAMLAGRRDEIDRVVLTASGGPFRHWPIEKMAAATLDDALAHPTWDMGTKVTVDSATMFNKALEILEACWLFDLPPGQVSVVVHPQSVIHSLVEYVDGSVIAQLGPPDMRTPIQYALTHPHRRPGPARRMDWTAAQTLELLPPDTERFPALRLAFEAAHMGGPAGAVLNAANEVAVDAFIAGRLGFLRIAEVVERCLSALREGSLTAAMAPTALAELLEADRATRELARSMIAES